MKAGAHGRKRKVRASALRSSAALAAAVASDLADETVQADDSNSLSSNDERPAPPPRRPAQESKSKAPDAAPVDPPLDSDDSDAGMDDTLEPLVDPRPIDGQGWDLVRLRQLADDVAFGSNRAAEGAGAEAGESAAAAALPSAPGYSPSPATLWQTTTGTPPEADWVRDELRGVATRGNAATQGCVAHVLARSGKRLDGMLVAL